MNHEDMLARLIAQAASGGGDLVTLRAIVGITPLRHVGLVVV